MARDETLRSQSSFFISFSNKYTPIQLNMDTIFLGIVYCIDIE